MFTVIFWVPSAAKPASTLYPARRPIGELLPFVPWFFVYLVAISMSSNKRVAKRRRFYTLANAPRYMVTPMLLFCFSGAIAAITGWIFICKPNRQILSAFLSHIHSPTMPFLGLLMASAGFVVLFVRVLRSYWVLPVGLTGDIGIRYTPESFESFNETSSGKYIWAALVRWIETPRLFLIYFTQSNFVIVPKRAFLSNEAVDEFRELIQEAADHRARGFPVIQATPENNAVAERPT